MEYLAHTEYCAVKLFDKDGNPENPLVPTKKALLLYLAKQIPNTELRQNFEKEKKVPSFRSRHTQGNCGAGLMRAVAQTSAQGIL